MITKGAIVTFHYHVTVDGKIVESTEPTSLISYRHGENTLLPTVEARLEVLGVVGHKLIFDVSPIDGYGERDESSVVVLPKRIFPPAIAVTVGSRLAARTVTGDVFPMTVVEDLDDRVRCDLNHPLAGKTLHFEIYVVAVRDGALETEIKPNVFGVIGRA